MSSRLPTNVTFSLAVLAERGGRLGPHKDGWGIAFNEGTDFRIIKEAAPASNSACLLFIEGHDFKSQIVISHIRRATTATTASFTNTHPFARELYGFTHVFAHNGDVRGILEDERFEPRYYYPQGETDSERAFCALMDRLRATLSPETALDFSMKLPIIEDWALEVSKFGIFNFLLSDSRYFYAHRSTRLFYVQRECVSQTECLKSEELTIRLARAANGSQRVVAVATEPLTGDEGWQPLPEARVAAFLDGKQFTAMAAKNRYRLPIKCQAAGLIRKVKPLRWVRNPDALQVRHRMGIVSLLTKTSRKAVCLPVRGPFMAAPVRIDDAQHFAVSH